MTVSRSTRAKRREAARAALRHIRDLVHRTKVNDMKGSHVTIWLTRNERIEWWPGAEKWRCAEGRYHTGDADALLAFVREAVPPARLPRANAAYPVDPSDVVILRRLGSAA